MSSNTDRINAFLTENGLTIARCPCVSPDFCLDFTALSALIDAATGPASCTVYDASEFTTAVATFKLVESAETGDHAWLVTIAADAAAADGTSPTTLESLTPLSAAGAAAWAPFTHVAPATWGNLIVLKNIAYESDATCTIFPTATGTLETQSLGIGARMTTLHWPAVDWAMGQLNLSLTANQNSIPRELVYDVNKMLDGTLELTKFKFLGCEIPEGHQGQSVEGMSHGSVLAKLKYGFHKRGIPWGFNADHQPVGGKYDAREDRLVEGCLLSTYITFDISHELEMIPASELPMGAAATAYVDAEVPAAVRPALAARVAAASVAIEATRLDEIIAYVWRAMCKMKVRDEKYTAARKTAFTTDVACAFFRELSIDEMPGLTKLDTLAVVLALCELLGMAVNYVAPAFGFQKNFPFEDQEELERRVSSSWAVCKEFGVSIGFHSGSGKSYENYALCGRVTGSQLEVKTSGRYTYELGKALEASKDEGDQALWKEWYAHSRGLASNSAFAELASERAASRGFIQTTLEACGSWESLGAEAVFADRAALDAALDTIGLSGDHMLWFEYNFLFICAAEGSTEKSKLGDHGAAGYEQRCRFYSGISDEGRLNFGKGIAKYILFLAESTGLAPAATCKASEAILDGYTNYGELLAAIAGPAPAAPRSTTAAKSSATTGAFDCVIELPTGWQLPK